jgi:polyphosphate glucokinase
VSKHPRILVIDVGGTHVKLLASGRRAPLSLPSGPTLTPGAMVREVRDATRRWSYDHVSIGYPGPVVDGLPAIEPHNLAKGWVGFDFTRALGMPVQVINDAAMQALGGYQGGRMLFLGLGTGLGSALVVEGHLQPLELAHLPYRKGRSYEDYVGDAGRKRLGKHRWLAHVARIVAMLKLGLQAESVLVGGGNARHLHASLDRLPAGTRLGSNADAFRGGMRLWRAPEDRRRVAHRAAVTRPTRKSHGPTLRGAPR